MLNSSDLANSPDKQIGEEAVAYQKKETSVAARSTSIVTHAQTDVYIDLVELGYRLLDKWKLIVACALIGVLIAGVITFAFITPQYSAKATIYVVSRKDSAINISDLQLGTALTQDYIKVFEMWEVHAQVIENLKLDYTYKQMEKMLSVSNTPNTRMLDISIRNPAPDEAAKIANEYAAVVSDYIAQTMSTDKPNIVSAALTPTNPVSPSKKRNLLLGFTIGALLASGFVTACYILDDKVKSSDDIRKATGYETLTVMPINDTKNTRGIQVGAEQLSLENDMSLNITRFSELNYACNEAINTLCTNLTFSGDQVHKIMVTSCHASEGKSYITMNILRTMSKLGKTVVYVDADLRKSVTMKKYGIRFADKENRQGLAHYLAGLCEMKDVVYTTNYDGAYMVPVGKNVSNSLSLLNSSRFGELLVALEKQVDYVIVDTPPLGMLIDAAEIASSCDGALIVIDYNKVRKQELMDLQKQLNKTECPVLGAVLNEVEFDRYINKKYYYKSYYYDHYSNDYLNKEESGSKGKGGKRVSK